MTPPTKPPTTPEPAPSRTIIALPPCPAAAVATALAGWGGALGTTYVSVTITNLGPPCALAMTPSIALEDRRNERVAAFVPPAGDQVALTGSLRARIGSTSWCGPTPLPPLTLVLQLDPGLARSLVLPSDFGVACQGVPGTVSVDPLYQP